MQYRKPSYAEGVFDAYWFEKNLQGDIVAVYSETSVKLISYTYDAWGNCTVTYHNGGDSCMARYNPFRYRGYYYDSETGFYYLNSRYYDPVIGRFINADVFVSTGQGLLGYNMFAYCRNNPVFRKDVSGAVSVDIFDADGNPITNDDLSFDGGRLPNGGYGSTWQAFRSTLKAGIDGLEMASGQRNRLIIQNHHLISNKHLTKTAEYQQMIKRYNYSLNHESNIIKLRGHYGRHTNAYHDFITYAITVLDSIADGDLTVFIKGMEELGEFVLDYPDLPYAKYK